MFFRPATPLSVFLFAAFALLLLSVLSAPIIKAIQIASFGDISFGVFGYCVGSSCTGVRIGYNTDDLTTGTTTNASDFSLPSQARNSLTKLLIVHPIAAFFTLVLLFLSLLSHLHSPSHSPGYLLALLLLCLPTFMLALLAFLVDILIFLPHVQWGGWVVLAATVLIGFSGMILCGMRRTLVGKVARRKRIQDNAEMGGRNEYYPQSPVPNNVPNPADPNIGADKLPQFATFEVDKPNLREPDGERIPLNPRSRTVSPPPDDRMGGGFSRSNTFSSEPSQSSSIYYGPPARGNGPLGPSPPPNGNRMRNQYSNGEMRPGPSRTPGPYEPPQRFGPTPPPNDMGYNMPPMPQNAGYGPPVQERYGPPGRQGTFPPVDGGLSAPPLRRGPPPGQPGLYGPPGRGPSPGNGPGGPYGPGPAYGIQSRGPPPGSMPPQNGMGMAQGPQRSAEHRRYGSGPSNFDDIVRDERAEFEQTLPTAAIAGMNASPTGIHAPTPEMQPPDNTILEDNIARAELAGEELGGESQRGRLHVVNESSGAEQEQEYVPPRRAWAHESPTGRTLPPLNTSNLGPQIGLQSPSPVELPAGSIVEAQHEASTPPTAGPSQPNPPRVTNNNYYEDVPLEFATDQAPPINFRPPNHSNLYPQGRIPPLHGPSLNSPPPIPQEGIDDNFDGPRSPAMSTTSNFTSISQRGINPRWQPNQPQPELLPPHMPQRRGPTPSEVLGSNPDFMLPGMDKGRGRRIGNGVVGMGR
ncbi:hypothetical protein RUND412_009647 [Rhizina undulata]